MVDSFGADAHLMHMSNAWRVMTVDDGWQESALYGRKKIILGLCKKCVDNVHSIGYTKTIEMRAGQAAGPMEEVIMGKYTGIKSAVGDYNAWVGDAVITVDWVTDRVTCTVGQGESYVPRYYGLVGKEGLARAGSKTSMREVRDALARYEERRELRRAQIGEEDE